MKKLQREEQNTSCPVDSGQESDLSPSPQSETSVSPKPDTQHPELMSMMEDDSTACPAIASSLAAHVATPA